jgi:hypothetical protein
MKKGSYKSIPVILFLVVVLVFFPAISSAEDQSVFGAKDFRIGWMHFHLSIQFFSVDARGEGLIFVTKKTPDKRMDGGFLLLNGQIIGLDDFLSGKDHTTERRISLRCRNFLTVFLRGTPGATVSITVKKGTTAAPPEVVFQAVPQGITLGENSTLQWTTTDADSVAIDQGIGDVAESGSLAISPKDTTTYTLTAIGQGGTTTASTTVRVTAPAPTVSLTVNPETILQGASATLRWTSAFADTANIQPQIGAVSPTGFLTVSPAQATTYMITVTGPGGSATASATISVDDPFAQPMVTISANPSTIPKGSASTLSWVSASAQSAYFDNGIGKVPLHGDLDVLPEHTTTYSITVTGPTGVANCQVTVMVTGNPEPQPEGSFGARYEDLVPPDATLERYDSRRFCLITGLVQDVPGVALGGSIGHNTAPRRVWNGYDQ